MEMPQITILAIAHLCWVMFFYMVRQTSKTFSAVFRFPEFGFGITSFWVKKHSEIDKSLPFVYFSACLVGLFSNWSSLLFHCFTLLMCLLHVPGSRSIPEDLQTAVDALLNDEVEAIVFECALVSSITSYICDIQQVSLFLRCQPKWQFYILAKNGK